MVPYNYKNKETNKKGITSNPFSIMKIVHIFWSLKYGGIETLLINIANAQNKKGNDVTIIIVNDYIDQKLLSQLDKEVHFICLKRKMHSLFPSFVFSLNKQIKDIAPDIIHLHNSAFFPLLKKQYRSRCCCTLHALPYGKMSRSKILPQFLFSLPGIIKGNVNAIDKIPKVFCISEAVQKALYDNYEVHGITIKNGILVETFNKKNKFSLQKNFNIVTVGRLNHFEKGQDLLINAIFNLKKNNKSPVKVYIIGEGESRKYLEELIEKLKLQDTIYLCGSKDQNFLKANLCNYDLFIQPSRVDGFGLTVVEAMCANVPVLVSSGQGPEEITQGNKYGWVFSNGNIPDLEKMIQYIICHTNEAEVKSEQACAYAKKYFSIEYTANEYIKNYKLLLK